MEGQHWIIAQKNKTKKKKQIWGAVCADTRQHRSRGIYLLSTEAFRLPNETDVFTPSPPPPPFFLFVWRFVFSSMLMGKWRVFGSYLDNSHIFPGPPRALEEEALVALPLSQSGTQLCASYSPQHYLVISAASLGLSETKSSQSQLSLLLNSFLFSVMHLLELFRTEENP